MTNILIIENPFEPFKNLQRVIAPDGMTVREWLLEYYGPDFTEFDRPTVCQYNGELIMRAEWETRRFANGDVVAIITVPQGIVSIIIAIVAVIIAVGAYLLMPDPAIPGEAAAADSVYTLRGQTNRFRPNDPIEVVYGKCRHWPTYAARPYSEYIGNQQYQYSLFCIGQGSYDIHATQLDDTPTSDFAEIELEIVPPGGTVNLVESSVVTALEVSNIELLGPNEQGYTGVSGPFVINTAENPIQRIAIDISFPQGLYSLNDKGSFRNSTVWLHFDYQLIDEDGEPLDTWKLLVNPIISRSTNTPQRITYSKVVPLGRYRVRGSRTSNRDMSARVSSQVRWEAVKGYGESVGSFGDVTMVAMRALATNSLNDTSAKSFNVVATRKLPIWHPSTGWSALTPTRNPVWAFCDIFRANYGAKVEDQFLDLPTLRQLAETFEQTGDAFDWIFDGPLSIWEAARMALRVGRAVPVPQGSLITAVRDEPQTLPAGVFNQHNIVKGSLSKRLHLFEFQPHDSVIVEYTDSATWQTREVKAVLPGRPGLNPDRVKFPGCTDRNRALREGLYIQSRRELQRKTVVFQTGLEGHIPAFMDLISITHDTIRVGQGGMIIDYDSATQEMTLSGQVEFAAPQLEHKIAIRGDDGALLGAPITVTPGSAPNRVILETPPEEPLDFSDNRVPPLYSFGLADLWSFLGKVTGIRPINENIVEITCVNYVPPVYTHEDAVAIEAVERPVIRNTNNPVVEWVTIAPVAERSDRVFVDWHPTPGAASYIVQTSYDEGESWGSSATHATPPVELSVQQGTFVARVAPFSLSGNVIYTESDPFVVGSNLTPPLAPELNDTQPDFTGLVAAVRWLTVTGAVGYEVDIYAGAELLRSKNVGTAQRAEYTHSQYEEDSGTGREITFKVRAFNAGADSDAVEYTATNPIPQPPTNPTTGSPTGSAYPVSWEYDEPEGDELEFRVYASTEQGFTPGPGNLVATTQALSATITATETTFWRVAVLDVWGPELALSPEVEITV
jgi:sulfur carrier protein ThiS